MDRQDVESRMIRSIGYDEGCGTLEIEFNSGYIYRYFLVDPAVYEELMEASSKGRYYVQNIRRVYINTRME